MLWWGPRPVILNSLKELFFIVDANATSVSHVTKCVSPPFPSMRTHLINHPSPQQKGHRPHSPGALTRLRPSLWREAHRYYRVGRRRLVCVRGAGQHEHGLFNGCRSEYLGWDSNGSSWAVWDCEHVLLAMDLRTGSGVEIGAENVVCSSGLSQSINLVRHGRL